MPNRILLVALILMVGVNIRADTDPVHARIVSQAIQIVENAGKTKYSFPVRLAAIDTLGTLKATETVSRLTGLLLDTEPVEVYERPLSLLHIVQVLGDMGYAARSAVPAIVQIRGIAPLVDKSSYTAIQAIAKAAPPTPPDKPSEKKLADLVKEADAAIVALKKAKFATGDEASLRSVVEDKDKKYDAGTRIVAIQTLAANAKEAESIKLLNKIALDAKENNDVKAAAKNAFDSLVAPAPTAVPKKETPAAPAPAAGPVVP